MIKTDRRQVPPVMVSGMLVVAEQIAGINLICDISKFFCHTVRHDDISFLLESFQIANYSRVKELIFLHDRFVNNNRNTFGFHALHDALDRGRTEVV